MTIRIPVCDPSGFCEQDTHLIMPLLGYFDESGKFADHSIVSFCGFVDSGEQWADFCKVWKGLLLFFEIESLHMSTATQYNVPLSTRYPETGQEARGKVLLQFIRALQMHVALGYGVSVDVAAFKGLPQDIQKHLNGTPHLFAVQMVVTKLLGYMAAFKADSVSLILDDDAQYSMECYKLLNKLRVRVDSVRDKLSAVCFAKSKHYQQLQAADIFASITRLESGSRFHGKSYEWGVLYEALCSPVQDSRLRLQSHFWGKEELEQLASTIREERKDGG